MQTQGYIWIGLTVQNIKPSVAFYQNVLGLPLLGQGQDWAHFDAGGGALFELTSGGKASAQPKTPAQQPLVVGLRVTHLDAVVADLQARGVAFGEIGEYEDTRWARFSDPEGNQLEIKEVPARRTVE